MYTRLNIIEDAEVRASSAAFRDRLRYRKFFEVAERFAAREGLVVGGAAANRLLLGDPTDPGRPPALTMESFQCDFYGERAPAQTRALAEELYRQDPDGLGHYTTAITRAPSQVLAIEVDGRTLFTITSLPVYRGARVADVVAPTLRPAQFATDAEGAPLLLRCFGPELQLMGVYAALCNPAKASGWEGLLSTEATLREHLGREVRGKFAEAASRPGHTGGGDRPHSGSVAKLALDLRDGFAAGPGRALVGPAAISLLSGRPCAGRLQVVTTGRLDAEAAEVSAIASRAGVAVEWTTHDPMVPADLRLRRLTVYTRGRSGGRREPLLDIFNAASHELIPYVTVSAWAAGGPAGRGAPKGGRPPPPELRVGTPFALMRFRLADIWTMLLLLRMGAVSPEYAAGVLNSMYKDFEAAASVYTEFLSEGGDAAEERARLFLPVGEYIGRLEDPDLAMKRSVRARAQRARVFYPPYFPAKKAAEEAAAREAAASEAAAGEAAAGEAAAEEAADGPLPAKKGGRRRASALRTHGA